MNSDSTRPSLLKRASSSRSTSSRPSLIADLRTDVITARWTVNDAGLRPVPVFYPPLNPRCTVFVGDAPPSVVAVRISECLRKRCIAVEFDAELHTATCMTMDRVHFSVNLYRGSHKEGKPDFSRGVIVECVRVRGDTMSFHYTCRAILKAALGQSDGVDRRSHRSTMEVPSEEPRPSLLPLARSTSAGLTGLEHALGLLKKDRIDAQRLGLESLVMLTDEQTSGKELAVYCSLVVLGAGPAESSEGAHTWVVSLLEHRICPGEGVDAALPEALEESSGSFMGDTADSPSDTAPVLEDKYHGGILRMLAMRTFANALSLLASVESQLLSSILLVQSPQLVSRSFLSALVEDLEGASRLPAVVAGTRLASSHEAALAAMCLRILAEHSEKAAVILIPREQKKQPVLDLLNKAIEAGRTSHSMLAQESEQAYDFLSREVRTC